MNRGHIVSCREKLGALETKLKVLQSLDDSKGEEKVGESCCGLSAQNVLDSRSSASPPQSALLGKMDTARRDLLAAAQTAEKYTSAGCR